MFKLLMGCFLIVVGAIVSFIPPFLFGIPIFIMAGGMIMAGLGKTTVQAAKGGAAVARYVKDRRDEKNAGL